METGNEKKRTGVAKIKKPKYEYIYKDVVFGELVVQKTANAWWSDRTKLDKLITAYKNGHDDVEARIYTGISGKQLIYFEEVHPEFCQIKEDLRETANLLARSSVVTQMKSDGNLAFKWLERKKSNEFGPKNNIGIAVQVNIGEKMREMKEEFKK
jgi:hypothetical protein